MAAPVIASHTSSSENSGPAPNSHTVSLPSGIQAGDLLLVHFTANEDPTVTWPAGWEELAEVKNGTQLCTSAAWREADGTEGSTITVTTNENQRSSHMSWRITGAEDPDTQAPEYVTNTGLSSTAVFSQITPTGGSKDYLIIAAQGGDRGTYMTAFPSNMTTGPEITEANTGASDVSSSADAHATSGASSFTPNNGTLARSDQWVCWTIAIHPPAGGPPAGVTPYYYHRYMNGA